MPSNLGNPAKSAMEVESGGREPANSTSGRSALQHPATIYWRRTDISRWEDPEAFSGYKWKYFASLQGGPVRSRAERFLASVNWPGLLDYATKKRSGVDCVFLPDIGLGYNHMVRIIKFADGNRWAARLRMPPPSDYLEAALETSMKCEFATISLLQQWTSIPIPKVHAIEAREQHDVKAPFMLMDCLEGNVGMDLGMKVPAEHKKEFFGALARVHVSTPTICDFSICADTWANAVSTY